MLKLLPVLLLVILASACTDSTNTVYVHDLGSYKGKVAQYGVDGNLVADQSGASVIIVGTEFKANTDTKGEFEIKDVPAGIYTIQITKQGFDTAITRSLFSGVGVQWMPDEWLQKFPHDSLVLSDFTIERGDPYPGGLNQHYYHIKFKYRVDATDYGNVLYGYSFSHYPQLGWLQLNLFAAGAMPGDHFIDSTVVGVLGDSGGIGSYFQDFEPSTLHLKIPYGGRSLQTPLVVSKYFIYP